MAVLDKEDDPCDWLHGPAGKYCSSDEEPSGDDGAPETSPWDAIVEHFSDAAASLVKELATFWFNVSAPTLSTERGPVKTMFENIEWITAWVAVLALLLAAGRMAWERRAEPAREALAGILRLVLSTSAVVAGANLVLKAGDAFSHWVVNRSTQCEKTPDGQACVDAFGERILGMTTTGTPASSALVLILALLLIVASLLQIVLLLARGAMLIVLLGTLPMAAALSSTETGRAWFQKSIAWLLAFLLYKPAAALVYAAGFAAAGTTDENDLITQVSGAMLLILAALTLPALMRIATPLVDSAATGGSGGASGASAVRSVASGALMSRNRSGNAKSSAGNAAGSGATGAVQPGGGKPAAGGRGPGGRPPGRSATPGAGTPQQESGAPRQAPGPHPSTSGPVTGATPAPGPRQAVTEPATSRQGGPRGSS
jgi:type IV secretion system protein TrbL